jgi:hypothetical protein
VCEGLRTPILATLVLVATTLAARGQTRPASPPEDLRAAPGRPGWSVDARSGCWLWNARPRPDEVVRWGGVCGPDGRAGGRGVAEWSSAGKVARYEGDYRDGKRDGRGVQTLVNGDRYEGEFRDDKLHGHGVYTFADGTRYEGEFRDDNFNGRGVLTGANGDRYEGEFRDDRANGRGIYTLAGGDRYDGDWRDGCFRNGNHRAALGRPLSECP